MVASTPAVTSAADHTWSGGGGADTTWDNAANWIGGVPDGDDRVVFDSNSTANLVNSNDLGGGTLTGMTIRVVDPSGDVTINGDSITLADTDPTIDMSAATRDLTINAPLEQTGFTYYNVAAGRTLTLAGEISGTCPGAACLKRFRKEGPGLVIAAGPILSRENWIIDGTVRVTSGFSIPSDAFWGLSGDAVLDLDDNDVTFRSVAGDVNTVIKLGSATLTVNQTGTTFCRGDIQGTGNFVKSGSGYYYIFNGTSYTGSTTINGGTLEIQGLMSSTSYKINGGTLMLGAADVLPDTSTVTVAAGAVFNLNANNETIGTLKGSGSALTGTGMLTVSASLAPGGSPGTISTGNLTLANGSVLTVELNGTTSGTDYDQVNVTGTVTLDSPTLNLAFGYTPSGGDSFVIIVNDGSDAVTGTFNGLAEGAIFSVGGVQLRISYVGGDGNDVVVSAHSPGFLVNPTSGLTSTEVGGTATFQISLEDQPTDNVIIPLSSSNNSEGTVSPVSLTFTSLNWDTPQTVTVSGVDDPVADGNQAYTIQTDPAVSTDPYYDGLDPDDVTVTNVDDEIGHTLTLNKTGTGSGTVTSTPTGIDCGGTCDAYLRGGTLITLTAIPGSGSAFDGWSGGGCLGNGECNLLLDQDYTITATFNPDGDSDGISDVMENSGPGGGDGNADGSFDSFQPNVATFRSITGSYVTLISETGTSLTNVVATVNPSCADEPENCAYPQGFFGFKVNGVTPGAATTVTVILHQKDENISIYYKYGPTPGNDADNWYPFFPQGETGAVISQEVTQTKIFLYFRDGQRGDDDLHANGEIIDLGAPTKLTGGGGVGGGGDDGCFISTAAFGSPMEPHVKILRDFRDRFLITNTVGDTFLHIYYTYSPPMAEFIAKHEILGTTVRWGLLPLVGVSWVILNLGPVPCLMLISLFGFVLISLAGFTRGFRKR